MATEEETAAQKREEKQEEKPPQPSQQPALPNTLPSHLTPTPATVNPSNPVPEPPAPKPIPAILTPGGGRPTFGSGAPVPSTQLDAMGRPKVDKYFGSKLPPVCRQLGCYVTDDGKYYYCINPHCHKDRKRETKYNRRRKSLVYFFCPKCKSREIQLHLRKNHYECLECAYTWKN